MTSAFATRLLSLVDEAERATTNGAAAMAHELIGILCEENADELRQMVEAASKEQA